MENSVDNLKKFPTQFTSPLILILHNHMKEAVDQIATERKMVDVSSVGVLSTFLLNVLVRCFLHILIKDKP